MKPRFRQPRETGPVAARAHGPYEPTVAPEFGARIVFFRRRGRDIRRPAPDAVPAKPQVHEFARFPLIPYSGALFGTGFAFAGVTHALDRAVREESSAMHGDARISSFSIAQWDRDVS